MEVAILVLSPVGMLIPGALILWAIYRSTVLIRRLHPLTPEQTRRKRKAYAVMMPAPVVAVGFAVLLRAEARERLWRSRSWRQSSCSMPC